MAAKDRDMMALQETASAVRGTGDPVPDGGLEETNEGFAAAFYADFARPRPPRSAGPST